jgi:hypothetical protein
MANEITVSGQLSVTKGSLALRKSIGTQRFDMTGTAYSAGVQSIATTAAGVAVSIATAVGTPGFAYFVNLDPTNYVEIGIQHSGTTFVAFMKVEAEETSLPIRLAVASNALYARANTSAVEVEIFVLEV